jgi:phosphatidylglycerol:prolipoprotein diacylglycerol transferase
LHPLLFTIRVGAFERPIYSYGTLILVGVAAGIWLGARRAPRYGLERFDVVAVGLLGFVGGIVGAAGLYAALHLDDVVAGLKSGQAPGMVFYGGLAGGALAGWLYCRGFRVPLARVGDAGAPGLALGHAFGRIGCLLGGCCYGKPAPGGSFPFAVELHGALRHPVQLHEAMGLVLLCGVLLALGERLKPRPGALLIAYVAGYALLRLGTELLRGDHVERGGFLPGLSTSQALAGLALLIAIGLLVARRRVPQ